VLEKVMPFDRPHPGVETRDATVSQVRFGYLLAGFSELKGCFPNLGSGDRFTSRSFRVRHLIEVDFGVRAQDTFGAVQVNGPIVAVGKRQLHGVTQDNTINIVDELRLAFSRDGRINLTNDSLFNNGEPVSEGLCNVVLVVRRLL